jgi:Uma2 family endonuclease
MREGLFMAIASKVYVPEAKPAIELIDGRLCQKVSPQYDHSRLQGLLNTVLTAWATGRGRVGPEWDFYLDAARGEQNKLVPDVAYLSYERVPRENRAAAQQPQVAPDVAIEILSPGDWRGQVERKTEIYLAAGTRLVIDVDPRQRSIVVHEATGSRTYYETDVFEHPAMPGFRLDLAELFAALDE